MIIVLGKELQLPSIYDSDNHLRKSVYQKLEKILSSFPKNQFSCIGKYKNGLSMDFCEICAKNNALHEVIVPYQGNDHLWPAPIKDKFKSILNNAKIVKVLSNGTFNPKKIKDMEKYINSKADLIIEISVTNTDATVTLIKNNEH